MAAGNYYAHYGQVTYTAATACYTVEITTATGATITYAEWAARERWYQSMRGYSETKKKRSTTPREAWGYMLSLRPEPVVFVSPPKQERRSYGVRMQRCNRTVRRRWRKTKLQRREKSEARQNERCKHQRAT